ncbi:MAG: peptidylprolyl isomerase [Alphaproteobacteria bacterium]|nr:peptidylprolyl isomerase [Alphaproteobacteria bacterium]
MSRNSKLFAAIALAAMFAHPSAQPAAAQDAAANQVIAVVNGHQITEHDVALAETEIGSDLGQLGKEARRRVLVEYVIETQLMADALDKEKAASKAGLDQNLAYFKRRAKRETYFESKVKSGVSESAAKTFFTDRVKGMKPEEEVKARHILVGTEAEARDIKEKLARGGDFAELAKESSKDPGTKNNGGLLGFFSRGQMVPAFEQAAFSIEPNEVSEPVQSRFGWHLILVEEKRQKPLPKFEDVKDRILNGMIHQKAQAVAKQLRDAAKIEYLDADIKKQVAEEKKQAATQQQQFVKQLKEMKKAQDAKANEAKAKEAAKPADPAAKPADKKQ